MYSNTKIVTHWCSHNPEIYNVWIRYIYPIYLVHFQNTQMPARERQRAEPGLSKEMNFDSRLIGTINK